MILHYWSLLMAALSFLVYSWLFSTRFFFSTKENYFLERSATIKNIYKFWFAVSVHNFESLYIFGGNTLTHCAITHSLKDGCLQAHLLGVFVYFAPLSLKFALRTLTNDLGCFPLDPEPWRTGSVYLIFLSCIRSFLEISKAFGPPHPLSALPQEKIIRCST